MVLGIVDEVADGDIVDAGIALAKDLISEGSPTRRIRDENDKLEADQGNSELFDKARKDSARKMRKRFAPEMIIQCVEAAVNLLDFDAGMKVEAECFAKCLKHPQREALIHMFFAEREVGKIPDVPKDTATKDIEQTAVIGCGTMGGGISMSFLNVGIPVTVLELDQKALDRGIGVIKRNYDIQVQRGRMSEAEVDQRMSLLTGTTNYADLGTADVIIEAVYENIDVKVETFKKIEEVAKPGAILASNTSGLDVTKWLTPPAAQKTSSACTSSARRTSCGCWKWCAARSQQRNHRDFHEARQDPEQDRCAVRKRAWFHWQSHAGRLHATGRRNHSAGRDPLSGRQCIAAVRYAHGSLSDERPGGPRPGWRARKLSGMKPEDVPITARVADKLCEMERFGQKTNRGFYIYPEGSRAGQADPEVVELVEQTSAELGITRQEIDDDEVLKRCVYALINEGARILEDGIAIRPCDIDIVYINGYGFPEVTGGPMFWADQQGLDNILADIKRYHEQYGGDVWEPAPLLERLVAEGKNFASLQSNLAAAVPREAAHVDGNLPAALLRFRPRQALRLAVAMRSSPCRWCYGNDLPTV